MRVGVKATTPEQGRQITAAIEIKGSAGVQRIALELQPDWHPVEQTIDWPTIGTVKEVVVLVNGISDREPATGHAPDRCPVRATLSSPPAQHVVGGAIRRRRPGRPGPLVPGGTARGDFGPAIAAASRRRRPRNDGSRFPRRRGRPLRLLLADLIQGVGVVLIALLVVETYVLGARGRLETGWTALGLAIAGAAVAEWWKFGLTGKHLTGLEVFQDVLASGLLATSASSLAILQAPASWSDLFLLSQPVAAAGMLIYHTVNAYRLATRAGT